MTAQKAPEAPKEETLMPEELTRILKEEWQYLKDETDAFLKTVESKAEFETKAEYEDRVARLKQTYISKVNSHIAEKKFDKRVFALLFKANLISYSPDSARYIVGSGTIVEAPYNTPTIQCSVPLNPYLGLADSVRHGYRSSTLYLKFRPNFLWRVGRDVARQVKEQENEIYFKVTFVLDLTQVGIKKQANIKIVPKEISLVNRQTGMKFWDGGKIHLGPPPMPMKKKVTPKPRATAAPDTASTNATDSTVANPK